MATIDTYKIQIQVDGADKVKKAEQNTKALDTQLDKLNDKILDVNKSFQRLATGGLALLIGSALRMADQMQDLADATGLTAGYVNAFSESIVAAGGKSDDAAKLLRTFYDNLNDMAQGSDAAERALAKVNISFDDLKKLSESELLEKAIDQLAQMEAGAERTAAGVKIFGKAFADIDPATLERIFATKNIAAMDAALKKAADTAQMFQTNLKTLQNATIGLLTNLIGDVDKMTISFEDAARIAKVLIQTLAFSYFISLAASIIPVIVNFLKMADAMKQVAIAMRLMQASAGILGLALAAAGAAVIYFFGEMDDALEETIKKQKELNTVVSDLQGVPMTAIKSYSDGIKALQKQLKDGLITQEQFNKKAEELSEKTKNKGAFADAGPLTEDQIKQQKEIATQLQNQNKFLQLQNDLELAYQNTLSKTIGMDEDKAEKIKAIADIEKTTNNQILSIQQKITDELAKGEEANIDLVAQLANQKVILEANTEKLKEQKLTDIDRLNAIRDQNAQLDIQLQKQKALIDDAKSTAESQLKQQLILGDIDEQQYQDELDRIKILSDHAIKMAELQKQLDNAVTDNQRKNIQELIQLEAERAGKAVADKEQEISDRIGLEDSAAAGAKKAMTENAKGATKYAVAMASTKSVIDNLNKSLDQFASTGKLKFGDLARSIIADLAKIALQAALTPIFNKIGGTIGSVIGSIFGARAEGGPVKGNTPYIVGEKGPELFVPPSAGKVVPNDQLGKGKAMGMQTPQNVTNNYITNNINAVDAKSVAQLFAENRKMLLGSVRMAEKELPYMT